MTDADKTNDILTGHGDAAPVINTDGVARADHAEVTDDGRVFLTASGHGEYYTPPEVVDAAQGTGAFLAEAVPSYDELRQACGEMEWELVGKDKEIVALKASLAACSTADGAPISELPFLWEVRRGEVHPLAVLEIRPHDYRTLYANPSCAADAAAKVNP